MTAVTIGLIELVGALNILITLTMIVLTKYKDIAVLMSMGARRSADPADFCAAGSDDRRDRDGRSGWWSDTPFVISRGSTDGFRWMSRCMR